jgi:hypothetical protein
VNTEVQSLLTADSNELLEYVKMHGQNPRIHPNGFIQLDLEPVEESWDESKKRGHSGASLRLHIWEPPGIDLPRQETINEIHDHVFDMRSTVVKGRLMQSLYKFEIPSWLQEGYGLCAAPPVDSKPPTHKKYKAVYDKKSSSRLEPTGEQGYLLHVQSFWIEAGQSYTQPAFTLHDSVADGLVITLMEKTEIHEGDATVICRVGSPPDNTFDRAKAADPALLWDAIERSILA